VARYLSVFHHDGGYVAVPDVAIEVRWADNAYDRLPAMAAELVQGVPSRGKL
jgi:hypothetical protein